MSESAGRHMFAEIAEQPAVLARLIRDAGAEIVKISAAIAARRPRFVLLAARGTSDHAALYAKYLVEVMLGLPAGLVSPSSMTVYASRPDLRDVLFISISQSGGSPDLIDTLTVARGCGALTVAVTNNPDSELARAAELSVDVQAGRERAVAATKSYTAELVALYLLLTPLAAAPVAPPGGAGTPAQRGPATAAGFTALADALGAAAEATLSHSDAVAAAANRYRFAGRLITTARGFSYPTAREGALKLMETCYLGAQAFSGADLLHGPMAMVDAELPVIAVVTPGSGGRAMAPVLDRLHERGADLLIVGDSGGAELRLPVLTAGLPEQLFPVLEILPLQQLAGQLAVLRGGDPDAPRGLSKVTQTW
jgi:glucosamine--fructose-6-phosphate aminotransferase (isomerizing)